MIPLVCYLIISYTYALTLPPPQTWGEALVFSAAALNWPSGFVLWLMER